MVSESNLISEKILARLTFKYSPLLFIIDQFFRILILIIYLYYDFSGWYFLIAQFVVIGITGAISNQIEESLLDKYKNYIHPIYLPLKPKLELSENIPSLLTGYQLFFGYVFSFWYFYHIFENHLWYHYLLIIILAFLGLLLFMVVLETTKFYKTSKGAEEFIIYLEKRIREDGVRRVVLDDVTSNRKDFFTAGIIVEPDPIEFDLVDLNDTKIAKLESELKSVNYKTDAWMLESVFLGGLAFSGFLTVASANFLGKETETFKSFISHISSYLNSCRMGSLSSWYSNSSNHFSRIDLYIVIMLLCLLSSVFFLLILTLRLRLNTLSLNLDHIMRILIIFNAKEEEIYNNSQNLENQPNQVARFEKIQRKIDIALNDAEKILIRIRPVLIMMNVYRTVAIILFYIVLILSGFYFLPVISVAIFGLAIFTFLFRKIETYLSFEEIKKRVRRH